MRTGLFIDGAYLDQAIATFYPHRRPSLDYAALAERLVGGVPALVRYADAPPHVGDPPEPADLALKARRLARYRKLEALPGWRVRLGATEARPLPGGGLHYVQKGVDVALAVEVARLATNHTVDAVALVAGDSDFYPLLAELRRWKVPATLIHEPASLHARMRDAGAKLRPLTKADFEACAKG